MDTFLSHAKLEIIFREQPINAYQSTRQDFLPFFHFPNGLSLRLSVGVKGRHMISKQIFFFP